MRKRGRSSAKGILLTMVSLVLVIAAYGIVAQMQNDINDTNEGKPENTSTAAASKTPDTGGNTSQAEEKTLAGTETVSPESANPEAASPEAVKTETDGIKASGKYGGRIDNNFIEIKVTSDSPSIDRAFQLSDELKENFEELALEEGDSIEFKYQEREGQNPIILEIKKQ